MKRFFLFLVLSAAVAGALLARDGDDDAAYDRLAVRAQRFYDQHDWNSATAMYIMMLDRRPQVTATYCHAITAAGMTGDTREQLRLLTQALQSRVPIDSLFTGIQTASFGLGNSNLYEKFLLSARDANTWMARNIDSYLMRYYTFRRDGGKMIRLAEAMLRGEPDSEQYNYILAQGYLVAGRTVEAMEVYRGILSRNPGALEALLYLGNQAAIEGDKETAKELLSRAYAIKGTPHVAATIRSL